jgi:hypothetical protein
MRLLAFYGRHSAAMMFSAKPILKVVTRRKRTREPE